MDREAPPRSQPAPPASTSSSAPTVGLAAQAKVKKSRFSFHFKSPFKGVKPAKVAVQLPTATHPQVAPASKRTSFNYPKMGDTVSAIFNGEATAEGVGGASADVSLGEEMARGDGDATRRDGPQCVECEEQIACVHCVECDDAYCGVCFKGQHRKGTRAGHKTREVGPTSNFLPPTDGAAAVAATAASAAAEKKLMASDLPRQLKRHSPAWYNERARFIPVRLVMKERKILRLLEATLSVCDYTGKIDVATFKNEAKRTHAQMQNFSAILTGLVVAKGEDRILCCGCPLYDR